MMAKQINDAGGALRRGRPKKDGELKESSVRIRPALREKLAAAAEESGESIARELEERLEATFTEVPMRGTTRELVRQVALATREVETETNKLWDKDLTTWAMLRELLANGPIAESIPHPDAAKAKNVIAANADLVELKAEREGLLRALRLFGPIGDAVLGARFLPIAADPRTTLREAIDKREDLPQDIREALLQQLARLEELDAEIAALQQEVSEATRPYFKARTDARDYFYRTRGIPDLLTWLTAPLGMDEPPPRRGGMFGRS